MKTDVMGKGRRRWRLDSLPTLYFGVFGVYLGVVSEYNLWVRYKVDLRFTNLYMFPFPPRWCWYFPFSLSLFFF